MTPGGPPRAAAPGTFSASTLAAACGGRLVGDDVPAVRGIRSLEAAGPDELAFVTDAKGPRGPAASGAGVLLVRSADPYPGRTVIEVADPSAAVASLLWLFHPRRTARPGIHPTAILGEGAAVDPSAEIGPWVLVGEGTRVGPECIVEAHAVLGRGCVIGARAWIHPHVVLYDGVVLADRVEVHSGAVLGADGFGYAAGPRGIAKIPQVGTVEVGPDAEIGANSCVDRATLEVTRVGAGTKIDDLVMVGHNCEIGSHAFLCGQVGLAGSTIVGDGSILAGQAGSGGHVRIGRGAKVGGQAGVREDVPDGAAVWGSPAVPALEAMKTAAELRRLPQTARLVRRLAKAAGIGEER